MSIFVLKKAGELTLASHGPIIKASARQAAAESVDVLTQLQADCAVATAKIKEETDAARQRGYQDGLEAGKSEAIRAQTTAMLAMQSKYETAIHDARAEARQLAFEIVRRVIGNFKSEEVTAAIAAEALGNIGEPAPTTVFVAPANIKTTRKTLQALGYHCTVEADETLGPHDCVLSNQFGDVKASLESQLDVLASLIGEEGDAI